MIALLANWKVIAAVVGVVALLGAGWGVRSYMAEHDRLKVANALYATAIDDNLAALAELKADYAEALAVVERERTVSLARARRLEELKKDIHNATDDEDGPVAPVLGGLIDGLRSKAADNAD